MFNFSDVVEGVLVFDMCLVRRPAFGSWLQPTTYRHFRLPPVVSSWVVWDVRSAYVGSGSEPPISNIPGE